MFLFLVINELLLICKNIPDFMQQWGPSAFWGWKFIKNQKPFS